MRQNHFIALTILASIALLISCKKESNTSGKPLSGKLMGTVQAWDDKLLNNADAAGVKVTITNLSNVSTLTDATGKYSFENLAFDTYDLEFSKTGHGTYRVFGITHTYNASSTYTQVPLVGFGKFSTTTVTALSVNGNTINGEPGVSFNYGISPAPSVASRAFVRYFLSTSPAVSYSDYMAFSDVINFSNLSNITGFSQSQLIGMGFTSGQTVYVKMYGDSFRSNDYINPNSGKTIFPNINPTAAAAVSFIVP